MTLFTYIYSKKDHFERAKMLRDLLADRQVEASKGIKKINRRAWNRVHSARVKAEVAARTNYDKYL